MPPAAAQRIPVSLGEPAGIAANLYGQFRSLLVVMGERVSSFIALFFRLAVHKMRRTSSDHKAVGKTQHHNVKLSLVPSY